MLDDGIPIGSEVICNYHGNEFRGIYRGKIQDWGETRYMIEVIKGTGHENEDFLHSCGGHFTQNVGWNLFDPPRSIRGSSMRLAEVQYDPNQNGDTDEDI